jgi:hypothetical protein
MPKSRHLKKGGRRRSGRRGRDMRAVLIRQIAHLPLRECHINEDWKESRIASIFLARDRADGRLAFGAFAVDLGCLGVKSAFAHPAVSVTEYEGRLIAGQPTRPVCCDPAFAVKLIQGACDYAAQLGFGPDPDYHYAREIFGDIDPASCPDSIEYGEDGKPFYIAGPYDDVEQIMNQLRRKLGPDGFHFLVPFDPEGRIDLFGEDDAQGEGAHLMMEGDHREW